MVITRPSVHHSWLGVNLSIDPRGLHDRTVLTEDVGNPAINHLPILHAIVNTHWVIYISSIPWCNSQGIQTEFYISSIPWCYSQYTLCGIYPPSHDAIVRVFKLSVIYPPSHDAIVNTHWAVYILHPMMQ